MRYQLVLWDFDGTLANTLHIALQMYNTMAKEKGYQMVTDPHAVRDMGMREFLSTHGVPLYKVPALFRQFLKRLNLQANQIPLNDGIAEAAREIHHLGLRQQVISSNRRETIVNCLAHHKLDKCFAEICGTSRIFGKEKPIRSAIKTARVAASNVLYVGDEIRDIEAANQVGIDIAAVCWGLNSRRSLQQHQPTAILKSPDELLTFLKTSH